jgi:uncharacterized protein DUF1801
VTADPSVEADIARLIADHPAPIRAIEDALRVAIRSEFPEVDEQVDFGNKLIAYGRSMKLRDLMFAVIAHREHVNLQLADGVALPDPTGIVEGTGKRIRHVKIRTLEVAQSSAVRDLIRTQIAARPG